MIHEDLVTLIESMRILTLEDDDTIREILSSVEADGELIDRAFRTSNNPISTDMPEQVLDSEDNIIRGYFNAE